MPQADIPPITASSESLAQVLQRGRFAVPWHQRYYDWDAVHVRTLLCDVESAVIEQRSCHFLGSVMLIKPVHPNKVWDINDGQQRIITFLLICAWLCKASGESGDGHTERRLLRLMLDLDDMHSEKFGHTDQFKPRVEPPSNDKRNFNWLMQNRTIAANGKLTAAWQEIGKFFNDASRQGREWREKFADFLCRKLYVVKIEVGQDLDPNAIFEVLNHRGKQLEDIDLIKNYIFSFFNAPEERVRRDSVQDNIETIYRAFGGNVKAVSAYVRCHLQTEFGFLHGGDNGQFYNDVKRNIPKGSSVSAEKRDAVFALTDKLAQKHRLHIFHAITKPATERDYLQQVVKDCRPPANKRNIHNFLVDLRGYTIAHPVIFALLCRYSEATTRNNRVAHARFASKGCQFLASYLLRIAHTQGSFSPSVYEAVLSDLARQIGQGKCVSRQDFMAALKKCPNADLMVDSNYKEQMKTIIYRSTSKAGSILVRIAEYKQPNIKFRAGDISVEHILPKGKVHHAGWDKFDEDDRVKYTHRLGNMTILRKQDNKPQKKHNKNFAAKKAIYADCSCDMTKELCKYADWDPKAVERRQLALAEIAAEIWNFK